VELPSMPTLKGDELIPIDADTMMSASI